VNNASPELLTARAKSHKAEKNPFFRWVSAVSFTLSVSLVITLVFCYLLRPDFCAVITFLPAWFWLVPGGLLMLLGRKVNRWARAVAMLAWLIFVGLCVQEASSLLRGCAWLAKSHETAKDASSLRVVSLNCAGGSLDAAREVIQYQPDIVLLQEAPAREQVKTLAQQLFGDEGMVVQTLDTAILSRGYVEQIDLPPTSRTFMTAAQVELPSGLEMQVISVHLPPPATGINLFSRSCWKEHSEDRKLRREQVDRIAEQVKSVSGIVPIILGGDFNVSAADGALRPLKPWLRDSFSEAGMGWGNTAPSHMPLWRIDQIWVSRHFRVNAVFSRKTDHSDHWMVVCDAAMAIGIPKQCR